MNTRVVAVPCGAGKPAMAGTPGIGGGRSVFEPPAYPHNIVTRVLVVRTERPSYLWSNAGAILSTYCLVHRRDGGYSGKNSALCFVKLNRQ